MYQTNKILVNTVYCFLIIDTMALRAGWTGFAGRGPLFGDPAIEKSRFVLSISLFTRAVLLFTTYPKKLR